MRCIKKTKIQMRIHVLISSSKIFWGKCYEAAGKDMSFKMETKYQIRRRHNIHHFVLTKCKPSLKKCNIS